MTPDPRTNPPRGRVLLALSLLLNLLLLVGLILALAGPSADDSEPTLYERHYSGEAAAADKVAVVRISGVLLEGMTAYPHRQIERAAKDRAVKAVVVRIDSPGGTISASADLHRALVQLRDDTHPRFRGTGPKPLVASMGSVAASGGYYVAMPARKVVAEPTTITGSIGVFAALPNVAELANQNGVRVELVKAGAIKAGGSPFQPLFPDERQPWQDMVDHAYDQFLAVVAEGRPGLTKERLAGEKVERRAPKYDDKGNPIRGPDGNPVLLTTTRYRADGGTYTPPQAKDLGLIDDVGTLPDAVRLAAESAGLTRYRAVTYERQKGLAELLLGVDARSPVMPLSAEALASSACPRFWYLTPGYEVQALLSFSRSGVR